MPRANTKKKPATKGKTTAKGKKKNNAAARSYAGEIAGIVLCALGVFTFLCVFITDSTGILGSMTLRLLSGVFGLGAYAIPFAMAVGGVVCIAQSRWNIRGLYIFLSCLAVVCVLCLIHLFDIPDLQATVHGQGFSGTVYQGYTDGHEAMAGGGALAALLLYPLVLYLGRAGAFVVLWTLLLIAAIVGPGLSLRRMTQQVGQTVSHTVSHTVNAVTTRVQQAQQARSAPKLYMDDIRQEAVVPPSEAADVEFLGDDIFRQTEEAKEEEDELDLLGTHPIPFIYENGGADDVQQPPLQEQAGTPPPFTRVPSQEPLAATHPLDVKAILEADQQSPALRIDMEPAIEGVTLAEQPGGDYPTAELEFFQGNAPVHDDKITIVRTDGVEEELPPWEDRAGQPATQSKLDPPKQTTLPMAETQEQPPKPYQFPPIAILSRSKRQAGADDSMQKAQKLQDTLHSFGVRADVVGISSGPAITQFELQPQPGVKSSSIVNLSNDIALALAAPSVRIEAPIPGKAAIGIEIPNTHTTMVKLRDVLESSEFDDAKSKVSFALGRDIVGRNVVADLSKMPHVLIAGATGSGKSVCINALIVSLLYKAKPDEVKLIMIDPKVVELNVYNGIPHLQQAVVTDPKKAAGALNWAVSEMTRRYKLFADSNTRDLERYNALHPDKKLPIYVIIIDELSDLMMVAPKEVEDAIIRLAQMARAAGMHLVIATQRPSVDVITGIIKANIPSRIAFAVSSAVDSRTILDMAGAEKLLGRGDMLYYPSGASKPMRVQGAFVSDPEVEQVVEFVRNGPVKAEYSEEMAQFMDNYTAGGDDGSGRGGSEKGLDPLLRDAVAIVLEQGQASASFVQRRLRVGYARAARLIDEMELLGIVEGNVGSKPRQILRTRMEIDEILDAAEGKEA